MGGTRLGLPSSVGARWLGSLLREERFAVDPFYGWEHYLETVLAGFGFVFLSWQYVHLNIKPTHSTWQLVCKKQK